LSQSIWRKDRPAGRGRERIAARAGASEWACRSTTSPRIEIASIDDVRTICACPAGSHRASGADRNAPMATESKPVMIIPREKALFRLDQNGVWHTDDEKFKNQRIVDYFHSMIKRDEDGYFLEQEHRHFIEKVYFPYEDTPLFVFGIIKGDGLTLCLNTGRTLKLDPESLFVKNDDLYARNGEDVMKFHPNALIAIAELIEEADGRYTIDINGKKHPIPGI
jgi:hypothetical protein